MASAGTFVITVDADEAIRKLTALRDAVAPQTHVVIYLNGRDDIIEEVYGFGSKDAAQAWIDNGHEGMGYSPSEAS